MKTDIQYRKQVLKALSFGKLYTAVEISSEIKKSLPLTNRILAELVNEKIVEEQRQAIYTGGRRAATYSIIQEKLYVISVAMDQYSTQVCMVDLGNNEIEHIETFDFLLENTSKEAKNLGDLIKKYMLKHVDYADKVIGVGIGMPGIIDVKQGINYTYFDYRDSEKSSKSLTAYLKARTGIPCFIDNDSTTIAIAEHLLGTNAGGKNSLIINFGWGVGLGMILNGKRYRGNNGLAGEFSHIPLFHNNKLCRCGKTGCLETEASLLVIVEDFKKELANGRASQIDSLPDDLESAFTKIIEALNNGDSLAIELFTRVAYDIGRGIAILIHILNPESVIISGKGAEAGGILLAPIYQAINKLCIPQLASYTTITVSDLASRAGLLGAAAVVIDNLNDDSIVINKPKGELLKN